MKFGELIDHAVECLKTFNPVIKTIDSHADEFLLKVSHNQRSLMVCVCAQIHDAYEKVFLKQVFYGCVRYEEFLRIFQKAYYKQHPSLKLNDVPMYAIFAYIIFFRLEEIAPADFKKLVQS